MARQHDEDRARMILVMSITLATFMILLALKKLFAHEKLDQEDPEPEDDAPENAAPAIAIPENFALLPQEAEHRNKFHVNCPVCLESIEQRTKKTKAFSILEPCRHVFCHDCIEKWFRVNDGQLTLRRCPLCMRATTRVVPSKKPKIW